LHHLDQQLHAKYKYSSPLHFTIYLVVDHATLDALHNFAQMIFGEANSNEAMTAIQKAA